MGTVWAVPMLPTLLGTRLDPDPCIFSTVRTQASVMSALRFETQMPNYCMSLLFCFIIFVVALRFFANEVLMETKIPENRSEGRYCT